MNRFGAKSQKYLMQEKQQVRLQKFYSNIQKRQQLNDMHEEKKKKLVLKEKQIDNKFSKKAKEAEALRLHLLEKKQEKITNIQNRKRYIDKELNQKMEALGKKLLQRSTPNLLQERKMNELDGQEDEG